MAEHPSQIDPQLSGDDDERMPIEGNRLVAPFTRAEAQALNDYQLAEFLHPFTCGLREDHPDDDGILVATRKGWSCSVPTCSYTQDWAHTWMADPVWLQDAYARHEALMNRLQAE